MNILRSLFLVLRSNRFTSILVMFPALLKKNSYLRQEGWITSFRRMLPVDAKGGALPWYTYPVIHFLKNRVKPEMKVFEYGSGNSTLWWASRVSQVVSCEHDEVWYESMKGILPSNVSYFHYEYENDGYYSKKASEYKNEFDVIVIDGRDRVNCAYNAVNALNDGGVVVWDNTDRESYQPGYDFLMEKGFKRLDFSGIGPSNYTGWLTSVFYRPGNCLDL